MTDIRLARAVEIPADDSPEGKLFRALQTVFDAYNKVEELPTPRERDRLRRAASDALEAYFVEKLAGKALPYSSATADSKRMK